MKGGDCVERNEGKGTVGKGDCGKGMKRGDCGERNEGSELWEKD